MRWWVIASVVGCGPKAETSSNGSSTPEVPGGGSTPTTTPIQVHPVGWADPANHGHAAKYQDLACPTCHGADLDGGTSGVSCDACHAAGWRTTCTYCHGGVETPDGAPPENLDDSSSEADLARFPAHTVHVTGTTHPAWGCDVCHPVPTDALTPGHGLIGDDTPGVAEVTLADGTYSNGTCENVYCHGDGQTPGTADATFTTGCDACHPSWKSAESAISGMSGRHHLHVTDYLFDCSECHSATVDRSHRIVDPDVHVDGEATVVLPTGMTWDPSKKTCTGTCHSAIHSKNGW